jgi:hypothetical protein
MKRKELFINPTTNEFFLRQWNLEYVSSNFIGGIPVGPTTRMSEKDTAIRDKFIAKGFVPVCIVSGFNVSLIANFPYKSINSRSVK